VLHGSVTRLITGLKDGDDDAVYDLWGRFRGDFERVARRHLDESSRRVFDEEDVALAAFYTFCQKASQGEFAELYNRDHLWKLLRTIIAREANTQARDQRRQRRGGGRVHGESVFVTRADERSPGLDCQGGDDGTPDEMLMSAEQVQRLFDCLGDDTLVQIARWKSEGETNVTIAKRLGVDPVTVKRKLDRILSKWETALS
jgi:DNA-directed RNA polymerase specialized sigma24 family protein